MVQKKSLITSGGDQTLRNYKGIFIINYRHTHRYMFIFWPFLEFNASSNKVTILLRKYV